MENLEKYNLCTEPMPKPFLSGQRDAILGVVRSIELHRSRLSKADTNRKYLLALMDLKCQLDVLNRLIKANTIRYLLNSYLHAFYFSPYDRDESMYDQVIILLADFHFKKPF